MTNTAKRTIGVVGIDWRQQHASLLAELTIPREERVETLRPLRDRAGVAELVYIATCGRVEVVFTTDETDSIAATRRRIFEALTGRAPLDDEAEAAIRSWHGDRAIEHLFTVASGLDSARIGESEVAGQLRDALADARGRYEWIGTRACLHGGPARRTAREADHRRANRQRLTRRYRGATCRRTIAARRRRRCGHWCIGDDRAVRKVAG